MKTTLYKIHKWVGLGLGILFLMQAVTGLLLTHKNALRSMFEEGAGIDVSQPHQPLDQLIDVVASAFPDYRLERIIYAEDPSLPLIARILPRDGGNYKIVTLDPVSAQIISSGSLWSFPLQLSERIHVALVTGGIGHNILLFEGIALVFMSVSGLIVWWPRKNKFAKALVIHWGSSSLRLIRDIHAVPGALTAVLMFLAGLTGAMIIGDDYVKPVVAAMAPVGPDYKLELAETNVSVPEITWQRAFDRLKERLPDGRLRQLRFRGEDGRVLATVMVAQNALNPRAHHIAAVDRWTDQVMVLSDGNNLLAGDAILEWLLPLHTGEAFGPLRSILMTILGLALAGMAVTGLMLWLQKRPKKKSTVRVLDKNTVKSEQG